MTSELPGLRDAMLSVLRRAYHRGRSGENLCSEELDAALAALRQSLREHPEWLAELIDESTPVVGLTVGELRVAMQSLPDDAAVYVDCGFYGNGILRAFENATDNISPPWGTDPMSESTVGLLEIEVVAWFAPPTTEAAERHIREESA